MELLPTIIVFIIVALVLVGVFSLISFIYFRLKRKRRFLTEEFSPNENVDIPYLEMTPLNKPRAKDDLFTEQPVPKSSQRNLNLSNIRNSKISSMSVSIPQINNSKTMHTTADDIGDSDEKYEYIVRLVNYTKGGLEFHTNDVSAIRSTKVFKHLKWETSFVTSPVVQRQFYTEKDANFADLLDIFKLQLGQFKAVKFTVQVTIKSCENERTYYIDDLPKSEKVEAISQEQYERLREELKNE